MTVLRWSYYHYFIGWHADKVVSVYTVAYMEYVVLRTSQDTWLSPCNKLTYAMYLGT
jgi:hypothetical protein